MKRKLFAGLLMLALFAGLYFLYQEGFGRTVKCPEIFDAEADIKKGDIQLLTYGLEMEDSVTARKKWEIVKSYGFHYSGMGCTVTNDDEKCVEIYNNKVIAYLETRNGKNWYQRYEKSMDSLRSGLK